MLVAGTETPYLTLEWAMSLLLNHPNTMKKIKNEIDTHVGTERLLQENDLEKLSYLQNVINESLRLYPTLPMLLPREASQDTKIGGYFVPSGTMLMVNAWAIQRDPVLWDRPNEFMPERFEWRSDAKYKMLAFGIGRRGCPGTGLGYRVLGLALGTLIQAFEWEKIGDEMVDMNACYGLSMAKLSPLQAFCKPRPNMIPLINWYKAAFLATQTVFPVISLIFGDQFVFREAASFPERLLHNMKRLALVWYQQYVKKYPDNTPWEHFEVEVVKRFGVLYDDPIVELKNLKQTGSVQTYQEAFEALLNRVDLPELVAVSMFMGGLKPEVGTPMRMFQATTLSESYGLARMQEATNTILKPRYNTPLLPTPKQSTTTYASKAVTTPVKSNSVGQSSGYVTRNGVHKPYRLTQRELEDKRAKGQCFYCDQKYAPGHKCSGQLHSIEVICEGDFDNYIDGDDETYEDCVGDMVGVTDSPQITLNALSGLNSYQTMRVRGRVGKQVVHILIDCGNTHNFLDIHTAKKLGCRLAKTTPMQVSVANGQRMMSTSVCHDLKFDDLGNELAK
ncbi:disease resistance protein [Tanacetum coccineum]